MRQAVIVSYARTGLAKAGRGGFNNTSNMTILGHAIEHAVKRAGIDKPGACHLFRHAAATAMLENGADIRYIQAMLGHAALNTTQVYTHVSIGALKAIHAATHPGAKLGHRDAAEIEREATPEPRRGYRALRRRGSRGES